MQAVSTLWLPLYLLWLLIVSGRVGREFGSVLCWEDPEKVWNMDSEWPPSTTPPTCEKETNTTQPGRFWSQVRTGPWTPQGIMRKCRFGLEGLDLGRWRWGGRDSAVSRGLQVMLLFVARAYVACSWSILTQPWLPGGVSKTSVPKGMRLELLGLRPNR